VFVRQTPTADPVDLGVELTWALLNVIFDTFMVTEFCMGIHTPWKMVGLSKTTSLESQPICEALGIGCNHTSHAMSRPISIQSQSFTLPSWPGV
jgi:hypothetical protein